MRWSMKRRRRLHFYHYDKDEYQPPLIVISAGLALWTTEEYLSRDNYPSFAINYVQRGDAIFEQNGKRYEIYPGDVFFCRENCSQRIKVGNAGYLVKRYVELGGTLLSTMLSVVGLSDCDYMKPPTDWSAKRIRRFFTAIYEGMRLKPFDFKEETSADAYRLLVELSKQSMPNYPPALRNCISYIKRNMQQDISLGDICNENALSTTHCNRLFKKYTNKSPIAFLQHRRMEFAGNLLRNSALLVKEIAFMSGYEDPFYFSTQFKKHFGVSPSNYRKELSESSEDETRNDFQEG